MLRRMLEERKEKYYSFVFLEDEVGARGNIYDLFSRGQEVHMTWEIWKETMGVYRVCYSVIGASGK